MNILHTADFHLDWEFSPFSPPLRAARRRDLLSIFRALPDLAAAKEAWAVVVAGDLFATDYPPREAVASLVDGLEVFAGRGIAVFLAPGHNPAEHELLAGLPLPANTVLVGAGAHQSPLLPELTVYGFSCDAPDGRPLRDFHRPDRPGLHLGVFHGFYGGLPGQAPDGGPLLLPEDAAGTGLDYLALGHHHEYFSCQNGPTRLAYPGSPGRLAFGQGPVRMALLVRLGEGPAVVEQLPLTDRAYAELHYDLSAVSPAGVEEDLAARLDPDLCLHVILSGAVDGGDALAADRFRRKFAGGFFHLKIEDRTAVPPGPEDGTIRDLFLRRCRLAQIQPDLSPAEKAAEEYAMRAGLAALKGGEF
ncbi:MAG: metallophosphoesterase family protein [Bacteroidota bacterium]